MDFQALFRPLQFLLANTLSLLILAGSIVRFFWSCRLKSKINIFAGNMLSQRPSRCFRFPSVVHGCICSEVHEFFRRISCFWAFHFYRWAPVVHRWSISGNARWDPMESQHGQLLQQKWYYFMMWNFLWKVFQKYPQTWVTKGVFKRNEFFTRILERIWCNSW